MAGNSFSNTINLPSTYQTTNNGLVRGTPISDTGQPRLKMNVSGTTFNIQNIDSNPAKNRTFVAILMGF
jgi:hypothetical protein